MKLLVGISLLFLSLIAQASCEDGAPMAEDAATRKLDPRGVRACQATSESMVEVGGAEVHTVSVRCARGIQARYQVILKEVEDAVCYVKSVRRLK